jgi:maleylpyruvate isomerase
MYHENPSREQEIEAGAGRSIAELEADIGASADRFLATCATCRRPHWTTWSGCARGKEYPARQVPWLRWREVVLHHLDLDTGFDLPPRGPLVPRPLAESIEALSRKPDAPNLRVVASDTGRTWTIGEAGDEPALVVSGRSGSLLGWVSGRTTGDDLDRTPEGGKLPTLPPWA